MLSQASVRQGAYDDIFAANMPMTALAFLPLAPWPARTAHRI